MNYIRRGTNKDRQEKIKCKHFCIIRRWKAIENRSLMSQTIPVWQCSRKSVILRLLKTNCILPPRFISSIFIFWPHIGTVSKRGSLFTKPIVKTTLYFLFSFGPAVTPSRVLRASQCFRYECGVILSCQVKKKKKRSVILTLFLRQRWLISEGSLCVHTSRACSCKGAYNGALRWFQIRKWCRIPTAPLPPSVCPIITSATL